MACSWSISTVIVVLIAGVIASSQGRSRGHSENSNTNINTNHFGRRSNGNANTNSNILEQRAIEHLRNEDVDFNAEDNELTVSNSGEDDTSTTTAAPSTSTTNTGAATASPMKKSKKISKSAMIRRKEAENSDDEARRATIVSEIIRSINAAFADELSDATTEAIIEAVIRIISEGEIPVEKAGRSTRRNYNMNSNTNIFRMNKPHKKLGREKLPKLARGQFNPENLLSQIMNPVSVPYHDKADGSEEDISDSVEADGNTNTNINSNTNQFGNNLDDDQPEAWNSQEGFEHRRHHLVSGVRSAMPNRSSKTLEVIRRGYDLASALRAARTNLARLGGNYNSNSNINEFRRGASTHGSNSRMRKGDRTYPEDEDYDDNIRHREIDGNVNSNTNMNIFRRSGNHNVNLNTNYARRQQ